MTDTNDNGDSPQYEMSKTMSSVEDTKSVQVKAPDIDEVERLFEEAWGDE